MLAAARMDLSRAIARNPDADAQQLLQRVDQLLEQVIRDARLEMQRLHPALLDHFGLPAALRHLVEETCRAREIRYTLALDEAFESADGALPISVYRLVEAMLDEPGLVQFDVRLLSRRGGHEIVTPRRVAPGATARDARRTPALATLRHWLRSLGASWTESGAGEAATVTVRISPAALPDPKQNEAPAG